MKFTLALLGAIYLAESVNGRRSSKYSTTRAMCNGFPDDGPDNTRRLNRTDPTDGDLSGRMELTQVVGMDDMLEGQITVRSHWLELPESDDWDFEFRDAADCADSVVDTYDAMSRVGRAPNSVNIYTSIDWDSTATLSMMIDNMWSIALLNDDGERVACCNIEALRRATDNRGEGEAPQSSGAPSSGGLGTAQDAADQK